MSATSWFDLSSIQEQINKSLQEAAKIADEASKYDILNFDEMAKREEEYEYEDCEGDDEYCQEQGNTNVNGTKYGSGASDNAGRVPNAEYTVISSVHRTQDLATTSSDHRSFPQKTESIIEGVKKSAILSTVQLRCTGTQEHSGTSDHTNDLSVRDTDTSHDVPVEAPSFSSTTSFPDDSSPQFRSRIPFASSTSPSNGYMTPPLTGDSYDRTLEEMDMDSNQNILNISQAVHITTPDRSSRLDEEGAVDDFFGDQFNAISTIKKEKLRSSSVAVAPSETGVMSIALPLRAANQSTPSNLLHADGGPLYTSDGNTFRSSSKPQPQGPELGAKETRKEKKKIRKKTNKGGLDFFGMGGADSGVAQTQSSSLAAHTPSATEASSSGFSFFEPVGMLNEDSDKQCAQSSSALQSSSRPLLRLPGITFADVSTRSDVSDSASMRPSAGSSISKTLFSFFDNVEDEIDSSEDPILRQVELNKSNPGPRIRPPNLASMFFYNSAPAGSQQDGDDLEGHDRTSSVPGGRGRGRASADIMGSSSAPLSSADPASGSRGSVLQAILSSFRDQEVHGTMLSYAEHS
jgi:hypothetical protein